MPVSNSNIFAIIGVGNAYGQAGIGSTTPSIGSQSTSPRILGVKLLPVVIKDVSHSTNHTLFLDETNSVWSCGRNIYGQLGNNDTSTQSIPVKIQMDYFADTCKVICASNESSFAITQQGRLFSWGYNANGRLGLGDLNDRIVPTQVGTDSDWVDVQSVNGHVIALKSDGSIWGWGLNSNFQLGKGDTDQRTTPTRIGTSNNWIAIAVNDSCTFALNNLGLVYSCGNSSATGRTGNNTILDLIPGLSNISKIFTCNGTIGAALNSSNTLFTWGLNTNGSLSTGDYNPRTSPAQIGGSWKYYSASNNCALAISTSDEVYVAGLTSFNTNTGVYPSSTSSKTNVFTTTGAKLLNVSNATKVVAGNSVAFISTLANQTLLYSHGRQYYGIAGENLTTSLSTPHALTSINNIRSFAISQNQTSLDSSVKVAIDNTGKIFAWGDNDFNVIGESVANVFGGTVYTEGWNGYNKVQNNNIRTFKELTSSYNNWHVGRIWKKVVAGDKFCIFLAEDGKIIPMGGFNQYGEIANGTTTFDINYTFGDTEVYGFFTSPNTSISLLFNDIACGSNHVVGIGANNRLYSWGKNDVGQLGLGNTSVSSNGQQPIQLPISTQFSKVACGNNHSAAISSNSVLYMWGDNLYGQVGANTNSSNVQSPSSASFAGGLIPNISEVACGANHTVALTTTGQLWGCGLNNLGQIGLTGNSSYNIFTRIGSDSNWARVFAFGNTTVAIKTTGLIYIFGSNNYGQIGTGSNSPSFTATPTSIGWVSVPNAALTTFGGTDRTVFGLAVADPSIVGPTTTTTTTTGQPGTTTTTTTGQPGTTTTTTTSAPGQTTTTPPPLFAPSYNTINGSGLANSTIVGANGGSSYYGTHDQDGNTREWTDNTQGEVKILRGSRYADSTYGKLVRWDNVKPDGTYASNPEDVISYAVGGRIATSTNPLFLPNFVSVINSGNNIDTTGFGKVDYNYQIGKYEITNTEYVEFLNAVGKVDTYGIQLTPSSPETSGNNGISVSYNPFLNPPEYSYSVIPNFENNPVTRITWFDLARYCNWLHNEKPVGLQTNLTTESGAYLLLGATSGIFEKQANAKYWIPKEDEWYKAAYYNGSGYYNNATQNNLPPSFIESDPYRRAIFEIENASSKTVKVYANNTDWTDTRIDIVANKLFAIDASGTFSGIGLNSINPNGLDLVFNNPNMMSRKLPNALRFYNGALIGKIGINGTPFLVGQYLLPKLAQTGGRLYLAINDNNLSANNEGFFQALVKTELGIPCKPAKDYRRIQLRRGNEQDFIDSYTVLASGEPAYAFDTGTLKIGDGSNTWLNLPVLATTAGNNQLEINEQAVYDVIKNIFISGNRTAVVLDDQNRQISYNAGTEPQIFEIEALNVTVNQNNFNLGNKAIARISTTAGVQFTGFVAGVPGEMKIIYNAGSFNLSILHNSSSSSAGNRVLTSNSSTYVLPPNNGVSILYDNINGAWRLF